MGVAISEGTSSGYRLRLLRAQVKEGRHVLQDVVFLFSSKTLPRLIVLVVLHQPDSVFPDITRRSHCRKATTAAQHRVHDVKIAVLAPMPTPA